MKTFNNIAEISVSYSSKIAPSDRVKVTSAKDAEKVLREFIGTETIELYETFCMLLLNRANQVIGAYRVSSGGLAGCIADPKLIFSVALKALAHGLIVCHNHPSGNMTASRADLDLTKRLVEIGKMLELPVMDHIILSPENGKFLSLAEEGLM